MRNKILIYSAVVFALFVGAYLALSCYSLTRSNIQELLVDSLDPETNLYPPKLAEYYLFNFRGDKKDIEFLEAHNGLGFVLSSPNIPPKTVFNYLEFFLGKGCNIDSVGFDGFTALHGAIFENKPEYVSFLLQKGADPKIKVGYSRIYGKEERTSYFGMNSIELTNYLVEKDKRDRSVIIAMLSQ